MTVRRFIFPVVWLVVCAVIAAALFKLAFVDGMKTDAASAEAPSAQVSTPLIPAALGTVDNTLQIQGSVVSDPAVTVKSTGGGIVDFIFVKAGDKVVKGAPLVQLKIPVEAQAPAVADSDAADPPAAPKVPLYTYADVVATAEGTVDQVSVLLKQQVAVGAEVASLNPGTFSATGTLTPDQQFRILGRTGTATVTVNGGPAPFLCSEVSMGKAPATDAGAGSSGQQPAAPAGMQEPAAGSVSCAVPADIAVFSGLGAAIEITAGRAENVVTIPTTAVRGKVQNGVVWVLPEGAAKDGAAAPAGEAREREVTLGLNDGKTVEISSGLAEGEMVLQFVPGAPAEEQAHSMPGGLGG